jgi:hypothetical protein
MDQVFQVVVGAQGGMGTAMAQADHDQLVGVGRGDERGKVLVLVEVAVEERQLLVPMSRIIDGIDVEGQAARRRGERGDELIDEDIA